MPKSELEMRDKPINLFIIFEMVAQYRPPGSSKKKCFKAPEINFSGNSGVAGISIWRLWRFVSLFQSKIATQRLQCIDYA
jgi:hypothetical protein